MPSFNHAHFIVDSVTSVLCQTHADLELIITDDCSSDGSWALINKIADEDSRIKLIKHERNQGLPSARNHGLRLAEGSFIAFCDSDDVWEAAKLSTQLHLLESNPGFDVVYGDTLIINGDGSLTGQRFSEVHPLPSVPSGWLFHELVHGNFINVQTALMRKECLQSVRHFDEDLGVLEDWWYWVQLSQHHRFLYSPEPLARYRIHSQSSNVVKKRAFCVNRIKIFRRMQRKCCGLSTCAKADINYDIGVDLWTLGKNRSARRFLWAVVRLSIADPRAFNRCCKAVVRLTLSTARPRTRFASCEV
jgi:glycosyltransferase involved in cell wall biosynthesis